MVGLRDRYRKALAFSKDYLNFWLNLPFVTDIFYYILVGCIYMLSKMEGNVI